MTQIFKKVDISQKSRQKNGSKMMKKMTERKKLTESKIKTFKGG